MMTPEEITKSYVTPSIEEAATLHALGCPILNGKPIPSSDLSRYIKAGYYVREGSVGFVVSMERDDFPELLRAYADKLVKVPVAAYQDGVNICKRLLKEEERHGR